MISWSRNRRSPYLEAVAVDDALPIDPEAVQLWMTDIQKGSRWILRPVLQFIFAILLHITWFLKRLPLPQFSAHNFLQRQICFYCNWFVTPEANELILRHFATESNILNFLKENTEASDVAAMTLYPRNVDDMLAATFVEHDQELFRVMRDLSPTDRDGWPKDPADLKWTLWRDIDIDPAVRERRWTQVLDFETAHALFMCLFCFLLTAEQYRDSINGFKLDQSIAVKIGEMIGDPTLPELAYNKYPFYLVGPWNLGERFLMHGFFTEYLYARLEKLRLETTPAES
ncbi:MAG: hypothetical protein AAFN50_01610 [Pseudomonadota bacterium]